MQSFGVGWAARLFLVIIGLAGFSQQWDVVQQTIGYVWPQPQSMTSSNTTIFGLTAADFDFAYYGIKDCSIIDDALKRYYAIIFNPVRLSAPTPGSTSTSLKGLHRKKAKPGRSKLLANVDRQQLLQLNVNFTGATCESWPHYDMDEEYYLDVTKDATATLSANSSWGILRGLETFSQIIYRDNSGNFLINATSIHDFPRFPHRGLLLDTSRHYVPKGVILQNLDAMAQSKYNVFHWHIVDDPSFPYESKKFPSMSDKGAYVPSTHIYALNDIVEVIDYARLRGIRVIPEYDTPGHTESWGLGIKNLLTPCYQNVSGQLQVTSYGPINPILNSTYVFLTQFFGEIARVFPDPYLHLGGDEVPFDCWQSNPNITAFMRKMGYGSDYAKLESYYFDKVVKIASLLRKSYLVWQEVFDNKVTIANDTVIHVWKSDPDPMKEMAAVTQAGYKAILSSCWYLNYISMGNDWVDFYPCDPTNFTGTQEQMELVMGGEACLWGEYVDATNLMGRLWPRALAPAERLWSNKTLTDASAATPRFEEHRCRMVTRGFDAEPVNGPSYCPSDYLVL